MSIIGRPPTRPEIRFFAKVAQAGDCWLWQGTTNRGYGHFWNGKSRTYAHRWAYEYLIAEVPQGLQLDHLCRTRNCVNPWHLEPVTPSVNTLRITDLCARGHEFDRIGYQGRRECSTCIKDKHKRYRQGLRRGQA